jgi:cysteinyl-tRNA synthetase
MSKSLGNAFSIRDVLAQFDPMIVRFYLIQHHYRTPLDINKEHIASAVRAYNKLIRAFNPTALEPNLTECMGLPDVWSKMSEQNVIIGAIDAALADDFNVPKALGVIFANLDLLAGDIQIAVVMRTFLQQVLGLGLLPVAEMETIVTPEIEQLIVQREKARTNKEWARADQLRSELAQLGYQVVDKK